MRRVLLVIMGFYVLLPGAAHTQQSYQPPKASKTASREERPAAAQSSARSVLEEVVVEPVFQGKSYVYETGRANPYTVVLVHGLGERASMDWEQVIPVLAQQYHVVTFDLPGFGRSEKQNALYSPANYASFVKWIVDERVDGPFTLVGHSMGGVIALRFASVYHRNLRHLILIDAPGILQRSVAFKSAGQIITGSRLDGPWPFPAGPLNCILTRQKLAYSPANRCIVFGLGLPPQCRLIFLPGRRRDLVE